MSGFCLEIVKKRIALGTPYRVLKPVVSDRIKRKRLPYRGAAKKMGIIITCFKI